MKEILGLYLPAALFVGTCVLLYVWPAPVYFFASLMEGHEFTSYLVFILLLAGSTVFVPITSVPFIPIAATMFGPFLTGVLSVFGWTLGGVIAFFIARFFGRPLLSYIVPLEKVDEAVLQIPPRARFLTIVLIRIALPMDIMSYALGLIRSINFWPYFGATVLGVIFFSFIFSYMGSAIFVHDTSLIFSLGALGVVLFAGSWAILILHFKKHKDKQEKE